MALSSALGNDPLASGSTFWLGTSWGVAVWALEWASSSNGDVFAVEVTTWGLGGDLWSVALWNWFWFFLDASLNVPLALGTFGVTTGVEAGSTNQRADLTVLGVSAAAFPFAICNWWWGLRAAGILADGGVDPLSVGADSWSSGLSLTRGTLDVALCSGCGWLFFVGATVSDSDTTDS